MKLEYRTTYIPISYKVEQEGLIFKRALPDTKPDAAGLDQYHEQMNEFGHAGWELVSVQPVLRGVYDIPQATHAGGGAISYSLTDGFYLFWKRHKG